MTEADLYTAYLLGCEDECIPEPKTFEQFIGEWRENSSDRNGADNRVSAVVGKEGGRPMVSEAGSRPSAPSADPELHKVRDGVYTFAAKPEAPAPAPRAEQLAQFFHDTYERLAPGFGYETRKESAKPWSDVPEKNRNLMIAVCAEVLAHLRGK